jgi:hypothetical protein
MKKINIPGGVETIGDYAFFYCHALQNVTIANGVKTIGNYAFYECTLIRNLTIPNSVTKIRTWTFGNCDELTIHCFKESYAHNFAIENHIPFILK